MNTYCPPPVCQASPALVHLTVISFSLCSSLRDRQALLNNLLCLSLILGLREATSCPKSHIKLVVAKVPIRIFRCHVHCCFL